MTDFMLRPPLPEVFGALVSVGRPILMEEFHPACCIAGVRLTTRVLEHLGYKSTPRATWARAGNRHFRKAMLSGVPQEEWNGRHVRYVEIETDPTKASGYAGHLVTIVEGHLVDLTSEQFHRPRKGIYVPAHAIIDLPADWASGAPIGAFSPNDGVLVYRVLGYTPEYRTAPDWAPERTHRAVEATLRAFGLGMK